MYRKDIIDRITSIQRAALYQSHGITNAQSRAIRRYWLAFSRALEG